MEKVNIFHEHRHKDPKQNCGKSNPDYIKKMMHYIINGIYSWNAG